jgi:hypothetical protein
MAEVRGAPGRVALTHSGTHRPREGDSGWHRNFRSPFPNAAPLRESHSRGQAWMTRRRSRQTHARLACGLCATPPELLLCSLLCSSPAPFKRLLCRRGQFQEASIVTRWKRSSRCVRRAGAQSRHSCSNTAATSLASRTVMETACPPPLRPHAAPGDAAAAAAAVVPHSSGRPSCLARRLPGLKAPWVAEAGPETAGMTTGVGMTGAEAAAAAGWMLTSHSPWLRTPGRSWFNGSSGCRVKSLVDD